MIKHKKFTTSESFEGWQTNNDVEILKYESLVDDSTVFISVFYADSINESRFYDICDEVSSEYQMIIDGIYVDFAKDVLTKYNKQWQK